MIWRGMKTLPWGRKGAVTGQFSLYHAQQQIRYFQHLICNMCLTYLGFFLLCTVFLYCIFVKFCLTAINEWSSQTHCHYPWFAHDNMVVKNECIFLCWRTVKNNNMSNQQKINFARAAHFFCTFLCRCFVRLQRETSRNVLVTRFMEEMSHKTARSLVHFFFTVAHFHLALVAAYISHFVTNTTKFSCCSSNKKCLLCFFLSVQISVALFLFELRWPTAYFLFYSVFLLLYIPNLWT